VRGPAAASDLRVSGGDGGEIGPIAGLHLWDGLLTTWHKRRMALVLFRWNVS